MHTLFEKIEKICNATVPIATIFSAPTVEQLAYTIRKKGWSSSWLSLVPIQPNGTKPPLFYVHGVLGTVLSSRHLAGNLDSDQPLYGIQAQGLQDKKIVCDTVEEMATNYIKEIRTVQPKGPYCLVGVSTGGIIAFEIAQQLLAQNESVAFIGLLDTMAPRCIINKFQKNQEIVEKTKSISFQEIFKNDLPRDDEAMIAYMETNYEMVMEYFPQSYQGKITFFLAQESKAAANISIPIWKYLANGNFEIHEVPGNHLSMIQEENVPILGRKMQSCLDKVITGNKELKIEN